MTLVRWDPFRELNNLNSPGQLNRFFDRWPGWSDGPTTTTSWAPNVDIFENENELIVKAELPGIDAKDVELNVENNVLTISGERKLEFEDRKENYHRIERAYGSFSRSFSLPQLIDEDKIGADYKDGVLTVRVPKHEKAKPRQIKIHA
jgi:HSP20 family protein